MQALHTCMKCVYIYIFIFSSSYTYIYIYILYGCESKPRFVAAPPIPCYIPLCRGLLLQTFVANDWRRYALHNNLVAKVLAASQEIRSQTFVAEWPPKPVTKPVFLIHSRIYVYIYIYVDIDIDIDIDIDMHADVHSQP